MFGKVREAFNRYNTMNKVFLYFLFELFCCTSITCLAQRKVETQAYDLMLQRLLKHDVKECTVSQADSLRRNKNVVFIDTREQKEYTVSHLPNAVWVGYNDFDTNRLYGISKDTEIIAYCSVGARSEHIVRQLRALGYSNLSNMYGSIFEWVNQGLPIVDQYGNPTNKVHAYNKVWGIWLIKGEKVYD